MKLFLKGVFEIGHYLILHLSLMIYYFTYSLTLTVIAENGGFRTLKNPANPYESDFFIGQTSEKAMLFRFDFRKPHHCLLDGPCQSKAFTVSKDITKVKMIVS
jgi:hypothetical protein